MLIGILFSYGRLQAKILIYNFLFKIKGNNVARLSVAQFECSFRFACALQDRAAASTTSITHTLNKTDANRMLNADAERAWMVCLPFFCFFLWTIPTLRRFAFAGCTEVRERLA